MLARSLVQLYTALAPFYTSLWRKKQSWCREKRRRFTTTSAFFSHIFKIQKLLQPLRQWGSWLYGTEKKHWFRRKKSSWNCVWSACANLAFCYPAATQFPQTFGHPNLFKTVSLVNFEAKYYMNRYFGTHIIHELHRIAWTTTWKSKSHTTWKSKCRLWRKEYLIICNRRF